MDEAVRRYRDEMSSEHRPVFDRLHGLSLYVSPNRDGGFSARHPELAAGKGTIKLRPGDAARIPDAEWLGLIRAALRG